MSAPLTVDGVPRTEKSNPLGYTEDQQQEKELAIKTMRELYPNVPVMYCDWVYDLCKNTPQEEMDKIKEKIDSTPPKYGPVQMS